MCAPANRQFDEFQPRFCVAACRATSSTEMVPALMFSLAHGIIAPCNLLPGKVTGKERKGTEGQLCWWGNRREAKLMAFGTGFIPGRGMPLQEGIPREGWWGWRRHRDGSEQPCSSGMDIPALPALRAWSRRRNGHSRGGSRGEGRRKSLGKAGAGVGRGRQAAAAASVY